MGRDLEFLLPEELSTRYSWSSFPSGFSEELIALTWIGNLSQAVVLALERIDRLRGMSLFISDPLLLSYQDALALIALESTSWLHFRIPRFFSWQSKSKLFGGSEAIKKSPSILRFAQLVSEAKQALDYNPQTLAQVIRSQTQFKCHVRTWKEFSFNLSFVLVACLWSPVWIPVSILSLGFYLIYVIVSVILERPRSHLKSIQALGKNVLITGANRGLGFETALVCAQTGAKVFIGRILFQDSISF